MSQVPLFVLSRLLSSLWVSRTGSTSDWRALQEVLYKCIDTIQYNKSICLIAVHISNFALCRVTFPVLFINSSRLSCLAEPGLGAPLSSYLEGALYKLIYR